LIESIERARQSLRFDVWAYVIMPEHVHLIVCPREPRYEVSRMLWQIKRPVARQAIHFLKTNAPGWMGRLAKRRPDGSTTFHFWQPGGGYDRNVTEQTTLARMIDYVHLNPVRRGLVDRPELWEWSSARWYAGIRPVRLEMDPTLPRTYE
jgi:putative transposase